MKKHVKFRVKKVSEQPNLETKSATPASNLTSFRPRVKKIQILKQKELSKNNFVSRYLGEFTLLYVRRP